jgi:hypothetical protein
MFEDDSHQDNPRPLPLYVAETWNFPLQYYDTGESILYAIQDWIAGIGTTKPRIAAQTWNRLKDELLISNQQLPYLASNGKEYQMDFTIDEGLYRIAQELKATKSRTALKSIKDFLAKAGVFADEARRDPETAEARLSAQRKKKWLRAGKEENWIANRNLGVVTRKELMAIVQQLLGKDSQEIFKTLTDDTYIGVFGMPAWKLRQYMGIPSGANVREFMSTLGIIYIAQAEEMCRLELEDYRDNDIVGVRHVRRVIQILSELVGNEVKNYEAKTGRNAITGTKLLPAPDDNDDSIA